MLGEDGLKDIEESVVFREGVWVRREGCCCSNGELVFGWIRGEEGEDVLVVEGLAVWEDVLWGKEFGQR